MLGEGLRSRCVTQIGIVIALFLLSCAVLLQAQERSKIDCTPSFPFKDSWWGADGAYSIPLPDGRSLWIFGDTLYGDRRLVEGNEPRMVRNSIGISTCDDRDWKVDYVIRRGGKGQPQDPPLATVVSNLSKSGAARFSANRPCEA